MKMPSPRRSGTLRKNLHLCFTKIVCDSSSPAAPLDRQLDFDFDDDRDRDNHSRPSPSPALVKNFNSLYDDSSTRSGSISTSTATVSSPETEPDFATVFASRDRFFFTSPGLSNSIVDSAASSTPESADHTPVLSPTAHHHDHHQPSRSSSCVKVKDDSVAVPTDSPDPYVDFRRSMQEMVEARDLFDVKANWDCLHELLLCYLALNPKNTHTFIISAFANLLVSLMSPPPPPGD